MHIGMPPIAVKAIVVTLALVTGDAADGTIPTTVMFFRTTVVPSLFMVIAVRLTMNREQITTISCKLPI